MRSHYRFRLFRLLIMITMCVCMVSTHSIHAESGISREYKMKAAFIYKFTKFIEWTPESFSDDKDPLVLTILGKDPFGKAIDPLHGKTVRGRKLIVRRISGMKDVDKSHILFIAQSEKERLPELLQTIRDSCVLTIGDMKGFADQGGIMNFIMIENTIGFEINVDAAQDAGLEISSNLLNLAKIVGSESRRGKN